MKIVSSSSSGLLGSFLKNEYGIEGLDCDIRHSEEVRDAIRTKKPDVIIHNAAITNVEICEKDHDLAFSTNVIGTKNIVDHFPNGLLLYMSTCHVFKGDKRRDYIEKHVPDPVNKYGWTKYAGEGVSWLGTCQSIVVRTSKLFDLEYLDVGIQNMIHGRHIEQPEYIVRSFVHVKHFCDGLMKLIDLRETAPYIVHLASNSSCSHYQFWVAVANELGFSPELVLPRNKPLEGMIARPFWSGLNCDLARHMGIPIYSYLQGIREYSK